MNEANLRRALLLVLLLALLGCASIPLGTMIRLARFGFDDLQKVDPSEIRAAIRTHRDVDLPNANLLIRIELADGGDMLLDEGFDLHRMPDWIASGLGLESPPADRRWIVFRLRDADVARFTTMQQQLVVLEQDEREKSLSLNVGSQNSDIPEGMQQIPFAVHLRLAEADGFFTLIKETEVLVNQENASD